jgi:transcriptional antiterminator NusG
MNLTKNKKKQIEGIDFSKSYKISDAVKIIKEKKYVKFDESLEVSKLLQDITEGVDNPKPKFEYEVGEQIKVSDGPFASFSGIIEEVDSSRQKLKVSVSIFGRPTPLELDYSQVVKG